MFVPYDKTFTLEHMTLTMMFDLLYKNFTIAHNFHTVRDGAYLFGLC